MLTPTLWGVRGFHGQSRGSEACLVLDVRQQKSFATTTAVIKAPFITPPRVRPQRCVSSSSKRPDLSPGGNLYTTTLEYTTLGENRSEPKMSSSPGYVVYHTPIMAYHTGCITTLKHTTLGHKCFRAQKVIITGVGCIPHL